MSETYMNGNMDSSDKTAYAPEIITSQQGTESYFSKKIVLLNVLATLLVVTLHALPSERFGLSIDSSGILIYLLRAVCQAGVPIFFFISALLFYRGCNDINDLPSKLIRRFRTLIIPYLLWNTIFVAIYYIITNIAVINTHMNMGHAFSGIRDILIGIIDSRFTPLWFIKILIFYTLSAPVVYFILRKKLIFFCVFVLSVSYSVSLDSNVYDSFFLWLPIYLAGAFFGYHKIDPINVSFTRWVICPMTLVAFGMGLYDFNWMMFYRFFVPIAVWCISDWLLEDYIKDKFVVRAWMKCTFFLYCTHYFVLNILEKIAVIYFSPTEIVLVLTLIISFSLTVLILLKIALIFRNHPIYRILTGGR